MRLPQRSFRRGFIMRALCLILLTVQSSAFMPPLSLGTQCPTSVLHLKFQSAWTADARPRCHIPRLFPGRSLLSVNSQSRGRVGCLNLQAVTGGGNQQDTKTVSIYDMTLTQRQSQVPASCRDHSANLKSCSLCVFKWHHGACMCVIGHVS